MGIDEYIAAHSSTEDGYLHRLWRATNQCMVRPHMVSGHVEGLLLAMLVGMAKPRNVLEIGTFTGYSAIAMSYALPPGGRIYTFDVNDELEDFTRGWIDGSRRAADIVYTVGDALELAPAMARERGLRFDMAFLDGNKRQYVDYYKMARSLLSPGGYILADNTLWDGHVADSSYDRDSQTLGIREFNDFVAADAGVANVVVPVRDGLTIIKALDENDRR